MYKWRGESPEPDFDADASSALLGKYILIGVTYLNHDGSLHKQIQMHGVIESVSKEEGIKISLRGSRQGESWVMPPVLDAIRPAQPGSYSLRSSNEVVENPDFLSTWNVTKPEGS